ncbi:MAG TPA: cobalamin biosynthesis protein CbiX [Leucothrix sp.]|nr:cobalamin biosynthesis protein CbiX [Leucothrix sp.]
MKYLLIVAHGSRRMASNDEVREVARRFDRQEHGFDKVATAFLELDDPSIPQGLLNAIEQGATDIVVLPYFLSAGRHVSEDIPAEVISVQKHYPNVMIKIAPYLGASDRMPEILLAQTKD